MSYQHKELLDLSPSSVSSSCLASLQQPVGILLLEKGLICLSPEEEEEPPSKRKRGKTALPPDVNRWIELAKYVFSSERNWFFLLCPREHHES